MFSDVFVCAVLNLYYSVLALIFAHCSEFKSNKEKSTNLILPVNFVEDSWKVPEIYSLLYVSSVLRVAFPWFLSFQFLNHQSKEPKNSKF